MKLTWGSALMVLIQKAIYLHIKHHAMSKYPIILIFICLALNLSAQQTSYDWAQKCGNPPNTTDARTCMASGQDGSFIMAGEFLEEAKFGDVILNSAGGTDIFIAYYEQDGSVTSAIQIGAVDYEFIQDVKKDGEGNTFVLGFFYGTP